MLIAVTNAATNSEGYTGWYVGIMIGFIIVTVVVILVGMILSQASRIGHQALDGIELMDEARVNTLPVWDLQLANGAITQIWRSAETARKVITGGP